MTVLAGTRHRVELPHELSASRVERAHVPGWPTRCAFGRGGADDDQVPIESGRRRDHVFVARSRVDTGSQIDTAARSELRPWLTGRRIEREQPAVTRAGKNRARAAAPGPRPPPWPPGPLAPWPLAPRPPGPRPPGPRCPPTPRRRDAAARIAWAGPPADRTPTAACRCRHRAPARGWWGRQVERPVDEYRPRLKGGYLPFRVGPFSTGELAGMKLPGALQLRDVVARDRSDRSEPGGGVRIGAVGWGRVWAPACRNAAVASAAGMIERVISASGRPPRTSPG